MDSERYKLVDQKLLGRIMVILRHAQEQNVMMDSIMATIEWAQERMAIESAKISNGWESVFQKAINTFRKLNPNSNVTNDEIRKSFCEQMYQDGVIDKDKDGKYILGKIVEEENQSDPS